MQRDRQGPKQGHKGRRHLISELVTEQGNSEVAGDDDAPNRPSYLSQIHLEWLVVLVVLLVVLVYVGWSLRPQSSGFPKLEAGMTLVVTGHNVTDVTEIVTRTTDGGAQLEVRADQPVPGAWTVSGAFLGGRVCTPKDETTVSSSEQSGQTAFGRPLSGGVTIGLPTGKYRVTQATGPGGPHTVVAANGARIYVRVCWGPGAPGAPVKLNGSYLGALFPTNDPDQTAPPVQVSGIIVANAGDTADFAIQSQTDASRATTTSAAWSWVTSSLAPPIHLTAVNTSEAQSDEYRAFLSGIVLGIAGGALITILQELIAPLNRRRDER